MDKEKERQETDRQLLREKMIALCAGIISAILLVTLIYVFATMPNFIVMAILAIVLVVAVFVMISSFVNMSRRQKEIDKQDYDEIAKAQRASYLIIKKNFEELQKKKVS